MTTLIAFLVGFYLGRNAEKLSLTEVVDFIDSIRSSQEVRNLAKGGISIVKDSIHKCSEALAERMSSRDDRSMIRRVA